MAAVQELISAKDNKLLKLKERAVSSVGTPFRRSLNGTVRLYKAQEVGTHQVEACWIRMF